VLKVKRVKEISFNNFLQEDVLVQEKVIEQSKQNSLPVDFTPGLMENDLPASETETKDFWKLLRNFFRTGEKPAMDNPEKIYPVLLAPYLKGQNLKTNYPVYIADEKIDTLSELLENAFNKTFKEKEAEILKSNLPRLEKYFSEGITDNKIAYDFYPLAEHAFSKLLILDVRGNEGEIFREQITKLLTAMPRSGQLLSFSKFLPFYLLNNHLHLLHHKRSDFLKKVKKLSSALKDLLSVEKEKRGIEKSGKGIEGQFDFANSIIAFNKMNDMQPESASEQMPDKRFIRIKETLITLSKAEKILNEYRANVLVIKDVAEKYPLNNLLTNTDIRVNTENICDDAIIAFEHTIKLFVDLIAAVRISELELSAKFDESLHTDYFRLFNWHQLSANELILFPPVIVIENSENLLTTELQSYSQLLASGLPIKVFAINSNQPNNEIFRQELSAITISHRGAYLFQGAADEPALLNNCLQEGLFSFSPTLWHLLFSDFSEEEGDENYLKISSAIESRSFPRIIYNHNLGIQLGSRVNISSNAQPDKLWPVYSIEIKKGKVKDTMKFAFTFVDEQLLNPVKAEQLLIVPSKYRTDDLISLTDYIEYSPEQLVGKIPFVWVVDEDNKLQTAAVPFFWLTPCKERSDFWQFVQELGGVNSYHVQKALARAREEWNKEKELEIASINEDHKSETELIQNEAAGKAMDKLASVLLDLDSLVSTPSSKSHLVKKENKEDKNKTETEVKKIQEEEAEEIVVSSEPWVESFKCTTCNDCTDQLPLVFKYNNDKQAYITDASKATFAQLVLIAEKCPAKCIHTGEPQNPDEPGLAELIKRAEPFK
jgi:cellobiose-specific phosphotransferase system component IIA